MKNKKVIHVSSNGRLALRSVKLKTENILFEGVFETELMEPVFGEPSKWAVTGNPIEAIKEASEKIKDLTFNQHQKKDC